MAELNVVSSGFFCFQQVQTTLKEQNLSGVTEMKAKSANRTQQSNVISSCILTQSHLLRQALTICLFHCILISFFHSNCHSSRGPYSTIEMEFAMKYQRDRLSLYVSKSKIKVRDAPHGCNINMKLKEECRECVIDNWLSSKVRVAVSIQYKHKVEVSENVTFLMKRNIMRHYLEKKLEVMIRFF